MKKIYFCKENEFDTKKIYKQLKSLDLNVKIKRKDCIGECKTCKHSPFSVINGKVVNEHITSAPSFQIVLAENLK